MRISRSTENRLTVATLLGLLWLPLVWSIVRPAAFVSPTEQRSLATLPSLDALGDESWGAALAALPREIDAYCDDHMGFRDDLIRIWAWLHIEILGVSSSPSLIVGKAGWLFFGDANAVAQYRGIARFDAEELERWRTGLVERRDWLASQGVEYLVVFVPNKHRIYAEFMPDALPRVRPDSQLDQLIAHLSRTTDVPVVDLRGPLQTAKEHDRVYHLTDTHWNDIGAVVGYREILEALRTRIPALREHRPPRLRRTERVTPGQGLARIVGLSLAYPERSLDLVIEDPRASVPVRQRAAHEERVRRQLPFVLGTGDPSLPRAVMFRDSFANALIPYLSESFDRIVYVWERDIDPRVIEIEKPDVVIHEIAERFIGRPPGPLEARQRRS